MDQCVNIYTAYIPYNALSKQGTIKARIRILKTSKSLCIIFQLVHLQTIPAPLVMVSIYKLNSWLNFHYCIQDDSDVHLRTAQTLLNELKMLLTTEAVKLCLQHVNSLLINAILKCKITIEHASKSTSVPQPFFKREKIALGKKSEHQCKFKKVVGSQGRKKSSNRLR